MTTKVKIDLNCDLGEGLNNEELLLPRLTSCNIACGAHAGSEEIIDRVIKLALAHKVKIGAHPSFPDIKNFGRVILDMTNVALQESLTQQLLMFKERAAKQNARVHHVKPHGALYNLVAANGEKALVVIKAIQQVFDDVKLYAPFHSQIKSVAQQQGVEVVYEAFADRNYNDDLTLVSRALPQALITDKDKVIAHVKRMVEKLKVLTLQGNEQPIEAHTFCLHGDNKQAIEILEKLHQEFMVN